MHFTLCTCKIWVSEGEARRLFILSKHMLINDYNVLQCSSDVSKFFICELDVFTRESIVIANELRMNHIWITCEQIDQTAVNQMSSHLSIGRERSLSGGHIF